MELKSVNHSAWLPPALLPQLNNACLDFYKSLLLLFTVSICGDRLSCINIYI